MIIALYYQDTFTDDPQLRRKCDTAVENAMAAWLHAKPGTLKSVQQAFYFTKLNKPYDIQIGSKKWQQNISSIQRNRMNETGQPASREPVDNGGSSQPITGSVRKADRPF